MTEINVTVNGEVFVTLRQEEYESLLASERMLFALEDAGVDNWPSYSYAYRQAHPEEDEWRQQVT